MLRTFELFYSFVVLFVIWLYRHVLRILRVKSPNTKLAIPQYDAANVVLSYFGVDLGWQITMNLGYDNQEVYAADSKQEKELFGDVSQATKYQLQLYHRTATGGELELSMKGKKVLEVGCGRGGGSNFIASKLNPTLLTAVDLSAKGIQVCKETYSQDNMAFRVGDAQNLPFESATFDAVVNVESSHCYPDFASFIKEVARVLKPGGHFHYCDISEPKFLPVFKVMFPKMGLDIVSEEITLPCALSALNKMSILRKQELQKLPFVLRPFFKNFIGQPGSLTHDNLQKGNWTYVRLTCKKRHA